MSVNDREDSSADLYNGQLLRDIKEVSKALYLTNGPQRPVLSLSPPVRSQSVSRTTEIGLVLSNKKKKSLVPWNWKKPLNAIAHFGQRRFDVCFLLHVHSIEGLPLNLDGTKLVVQWKRKDEVMTTQPSKVLQGTAEFEETLTHRCSVYGSKHGPHRSAKYQVKLFLIYVSPVDAPWLVLGKHWIDLTRILPLSLEEMEGTRSTRKWNTSFKLSGLAESAVLNLSFDYSVVTSSVCDSTSKNVMLRRVGSVPSMDHRSPPLDDGKVVNEVSPSLSLNLSQSIDFLYEKLGEQNPQRSTGTEVELGLETDKQAADSDDSGKGVETFQQERSGLEESNDPNTESSRIEIIDVHEILKDEDESVFEETYFIDQLSVAALKSEPSNLLPKHSVDGTPKSTFSSQVISESSESKSPSAMDDSTEKENFLEVKSSYKAAKISMTSLSLDDITESVANDFLNMLELEECSYVYTSDGEPTSPRESLLREFEKEAFASGNFLLDLNGEAEYVSDIDEKSNDFSFSASSLDVGENKREGKSQLLIDRRKAKVLEDLETETLLRECDFDDNSFDNSLCVCSDGFGSPIELPVDKGLDLLPLGDNIGPSVWTKGGGCIRSMNHLLFRESKEASQLIMQVSVPVVLVSELGSDILEILQIFAASGIEGLCSEVNALIPLEDIMGKTIHEVVDVTKFKRTGQDCSDKSKGVVVQKPPGQLHLCSSNEEFGSSMCPSNVPLEDVTSLAIDEIYILSIEGLKIQCSMSDQDPPSGIAPKPMDQSDALELIRFSLTLDEWLRLDQGMLENKDQDLASNGKGHTLRNKLTLALQVLLRDPSLNNEPIGASMLALIQVERSLDSPNSSLCSLAQEGRNKESFGYDTQLWRITEIGLAGLKIEPGADHPWCTKSQQQSGSRWLLANGTDKTIKCQASESKVIIVSNVQATRKRLDTLWSIISDRHHQEGITVMSGDLTSDTEPS
ncbi:light-independent protochlorophyllide reductase subunit [Arabidopsis thaliana]|uniref:Light-independent protochlorophyllide reductase subunit n=1 Tax=Arabidopsis thaliana TaxID=3702 RepID=A0A1R7T374_ARATH|nr:light-independent protochlorophyllide reductase subunit [Arabidopsis thaliana]ANM71065.1 light-independent protochlorophyllide reductase subunit [Arabidopsis thaliana]|eukprot:NP_001332621.1 light-independent protochlorophyllide reductase subunit [Arabidopsis thaliana]